MNEGETFVHCVGHNGPVNHEQTVYSIHDTDGEQLGVICGKCLSELPDEEDGKLVIYKGRTIPAEDKRSVSAVEPHGIPVRSVSTEVLMATFGNSVS